MATWALWVNLVGNLFVVLGLGWAGWSLLGTEKAIRRDRATLVDINTRYDQMEHRDENARHQELRATGINWITSGELVYINQDVQLAIIGHLRPSLSGPFMATLLGTVLTLVAAVLSFG